MIKQIPTLYPGAVELKQGQFYHGKPKQTLSVVVNKADLANFKESPEKLYLNKKICITGKITEYNGKPQIMATKPKQFILK